MAEMQVLICKKDRCVQIWFKQNQYVQFYLLAIIDVKSWWGKQIYDQNDLNNL